MTFDDAEQFCEMNPEYRVYDMEIVCRCKLCRGMDRHHEVFHPDSRYVPSPAKKENYSKQELESASKFEPRHPARLAKEIAGLKE